MLCNFLLKAGCNISGKRNTAELVCVSGWEFICVVLVSEVQISPSVIVFVALVGLGVSID